MLYSVPLAQQYTYSLYSNIANAMTPSKHLICSYLSRPKETEGANVSLVDNKPHSLHEILSNPGLLYQAIGYRLLTPLCSLKMCINSNQLYSQQTFINYFDIVDINMCALHVMG